MRRSALFFPALAVERWDEALGSGADMVVFDLEDGTPPARRAEARASLLPCYARPRDAAGPLRLLRVNHPHAEDGLRDLLALLECAAPPDGLILPKIEHDEEVRAVATLLAPRHPALELVVLIESPRGVRNAASIAAATRGRPGPQVTCLFLGTADFSASIGSDLGWDALAHARAQVVLAAREAGIDAMDGVWFDAADGDGLRDEARRVAAMGFTGKASYAAAQLPVIHAAFTPTDAEAGWATRVLAAKDVNEAIARRARNVLARRQAATESARRR
jgi:citrate lyase beta subunit